jgi:hypothetical protein
MKRDNFWNIRCLILLKTLNTAIPRSAFFNFAQREKTAIRLTAEEIRWWQRLKADGWFWKRVRWWIR